MLSDLNPIFNDMGVNIRSVGSVFIMTCNMGQIQIWHERFKIS